MEWKWRPLLLALSILSFERFLFYTLAATNPQDVGALQLLQKNWQASQLNWTDYDPCGSYWRGVACNSSTVIGLISNRGDLSGTLSSAIGDLTNLQILDLSFNRGLTGEIPKDLGKLTSLRSLSLQGCSFYGSVPKELGLLKNLMFFALNMNNLSGIIPPELGGLQLVTWFDIAQNGLTGPLPVSTANSQNIGLDNMSSVIHIHLFNNSISGSLPKELATLPKLRHLMVENNVITGTIPEEYGNFVSLEIMRIDGNRVEGNIPATLSRIPKLQELQIFNNSLVGTLPDFSAMKQIQLLNLGDNVYGPQPFPASIVNLSTLQTLSIHKGFLNGTIPDGLFQLPSLEYVSLANNQLSGTVTLPSNTTKLKTVDLDANNISQVIGLANSFNLSLVGNPACSDERLHLSQSVCLPITTPSWNATNQTCTTMCTEGKLLNSEQCWCAFPVSILFQFNAPSFSDMNQERRNTVKAKVANQTLVALEQVMVGSSAWGFSQRLQVLVYVFPVRGKDEMNYQESETVLNRIALHTTAQFPAEFGPYSVFHASALLGIIESKSSGISKGAVAGISVAAVAVFLVIAAAVAFAMFQKRRADNAISKAFTSWGSIGTSGSAPKLKGARYFTLHELKKATNSFSSANEIGAGGYGKVFKGVLVTGEAVAIKKAEEGSMQGSGEFKTEIELLSRVHHKNLVGLIGFCYEQGSQMLVYEYMANGSLRDHLTKNSRLLNWHKRLEIALDSAQGLSYLHELANPPIIHRDVKSSNILLDDKMKAKVADFGLGKLGISEADQTHVSTQVKGTLGYMDPEYYMTQQLTEKSDVYSFGVVLLELLTARQPISRGKYIVREVRAALDRGGLAALGSLLDPNLEIPQSDLIKFVDLALQCVEESGANRPSMGHVVKQLELLLLIDNNDVSSVGLSGGGGSLYDDSGILGRGHDTAFAYSGVFDSSVLPK